MVNIVDAFRKLENRDPTPNELIRMMEMKAEQDARRNKSIKPKEDMIEKAKTGKEGVVQYLKRNPKPRKSSIAVTQQIIQINKMIWYKLTHEQIADILNTTTEKVMENVKKYNLPRDGLEPIKYRK